MKLHTLAVLAGSGLSSASVVPHFKRWDYDVCLNDCSLAGVAMPDQNTFGLPLESFWSEQCPSVVIGSYSNPVASSKVCLTFSGTALHFTFAPFAGYSLTSSLVAWKVKGNLDNPGGWAPPPPNNLIDCYSGPGGVMVCDLPFSTILAVSPSTSIPDLMAGMCPNGDREALDFYFQFGGLAQPDDGSPVIPFQNTPPCTARAADRSCTAWDGNTQWTEVAYRCTNCNVSPCQSSSTTSTTTCTTTTTSTTSPTPPTPPTLKPCSFGTAFGYQEPVGPIQKSTPLNTQVGQGGQGCNRWGWYETPSVSEMVAGISGQLYVGAGGNDITKGIEVGTWIAVSTPQGGVTVTYILTGSYTLAEVHVDLVCLPLAKCAPGQYTYNQGAIPNLPTWSNPTPLQYPVCSGGSKAALIIHAAVNIMSVTNTCPAPKAT